MGRLIGYLPGKNKSSDKKSGDSTSSGQNVSGQKEQQGNNQKKDGKGEPR